jgi:multimeric flavodoxin WrbA
MKKVTAFVGSARKGHTYKAVGQFLQNLRELGEVEYEIVSLGEFRLEACRGCMACFDRGEESCPRHDDRDALIRKIEASDGVIFATPNYSFHVSGLMKTFLDRLAFVFHRPRFFGKTFTSIVVQGIYGGGKIVKYLDFAANGLGFSTVKGSCLRTLEPMTEKGKRKIDRALAAQGRRFHEAMARPAFLPPPLLNLAAFRMSRTNMRLSRDPRTRDYTHYAQAGWFESGYYYPVRLGVLKGALGRLFDSVGAGMAGKGERRA